MSPRGWFVAILIPLIIPLMSPYPSLAGCETNHKAIGFESEGMARAYQEALLRRDMAAIRLILESEGINLKKKLPVIWLKKPTAFNSVGEVKFLGTDQALWVLRAMIDCM